MLDPVSCKNLHQQTLLGHYFRIHLFTYLSIQIFIYKRSILRKLCRSYVQHNNEPCQHNEPRQHPEDRSIGDQNRLSRARPSKNWRMELVDTNVIPINSFPNLSNPTENKINRLVVVLLLLPCRIILDGLLGAKVSGDRETETTDWGFEKSAVSE